MPSIATTRRLSAIEASVPQPSDPAPGAADPFRSAPGQPRRRPTFEELDPVRQFIYTRADELKITHAALSLMMGRGETYLHQFLWRGVPKDLYEDELQILARALKVQPDRLRSATPDLRSMPRGTSGHKVRKRLLAVPQQPHDIPIFADNASINPAAAVDWTQRPPSLANTTEAFGLSISTDTGRLRRGDVAFVNGALVPRVGDTVVAVSDAKILAIGTLKTLTGQRASIQAAADSRSIAVQLTNEVRLLKVVSASFA